MANHRLRDALLGAGIDTDQLATDLNVDPKTVERWITTERVPYPKNRRKIALKVGASESYLWPRAYDGEKATQISESEVVRVYPHRGDIPPELWDTLMARAKTYIDILVYVGYFLTERSDLVEVFREKASQGGRIRMLFGERDCEAVLQRSRDEEIGERTISAKIDQALAYFSPLLGERGVEFRTHSTVLYNSIYRFDDEMIVNPHIYGKAAPHAPALHLRRLSAGNIFTTYVDSFTTVWESARKFER